MRIHKKNTHRVGPTTVYPIELHDRAARAPPVQQQQRRRRPKPTAQDMPLHVSAPVNVPVIPPPPATPARQLLARGRRCGCMPVPHRCLVPGSSTRHRECCTRDVCRRWCSELLVRRPTDAPRLDIRERGCAAVVRLCTVVSIRVLCGVPLCAREERLRCFCYVLRVLL
jgi:hypothetical protein